MIWTCKYSAIIGYFSVLIRNDSRLKRIAERWEPRLTKKPRKRDTLLKLFTASNEHDTLQGFVTETDQAINDFLVGFNVLIP